MNLPAPNEIPMRAVLPTPPLRQLERGEDEPCDLGLPCHKIKSHQVDFLHFVLLSVLKNDVAAFRPHGSLVDRFVKKEDLIVRGLNPFKSFTREILSLSHLLGLSIASGVPRESDYFLWQLGQFRPFIGKGESGVSHFETSFEDTIGSLQAHFGPDGSEWA